MIKLPDHFDISVNLKRAIANGMAVVAFMSILQITKPIPLGAGFIFGALGGSINDVIAWIGNKNAIIAYNSSKQDEEWIAKSLESLADKDGEKDNDI